jgi:hypothetical protein
MIEKKWERSLKAGPGENADFERTSTFSRSHFQVLEPQVSKRNGVLAPPEFCSRKLYSNKDYDIELIGSA